MVKQFSEQQLQLVKSLVEYKYHPNKLATMSRVSIIIACTSLFLPLFALLINDYNGSEVYTMYLILMVILFIAQLFFSFMFNNTGWHIKYQSAHAFFIFVCIIKMANDFYSGAYYAATVWDAPEIYYIIIIGIQVFINILLIPLIARFKRLIMAGNYKAEGDGFYCSSNDKLLFFLAGFGLLMIPIAVLQLFFGYYDFWGLPYDVRLLACIAILLQSFITLLAPEYLLIALCKKNFPSFNIR